MRAAPGIGLLLFCALQVAVPRSLRADALSELGHRATSHRSYKVRVQAVVLLGRRKDSRAIPILIRVLSDRNYLVRGMAAQALGALGDESARSELERAKRDRSEFVRVRVRLALARLDGTPPKGAVHASGKNMFFVVDTLADSTGQASPDLRERIRGELVTELRQAWFSPVEAGESERRGFIIDGTVKKISQKLQPNRIDTFCEVELILSAYPSRSILMMTSGAATVQVPTRGFRLPPNTSFAREALSNAVQSAYQNIIRFLQSRR